MKLLEIHDEMYISDKNYLLAGAYNNLKQAGDDLFFCTLVMLLQNHDISFNI